ncbi:uncharacterized protein LOC121467590 isoform X1 [Drosophila elegans]|uniref:uncharacterized protein LOC121467590 isoform X1 n=2 Tax=Drosophila elegans TaxID=30023 RepID=UPI001BC84C5F|nr:uncharacterized protein LOC121467590 isoform X1 [Drosophila elegans]XP_041565318.1 uncharacterized protein LOC121467590 isoform X1 [Drosophila elegans]
MYVMRILMCIWTVPALFTVATSSNGTEQIKLFRSNNGVKAADLGEDDVGWTNINEEVDVVTPLVIVHLQKLGIEHFQLPDMKESISIKPFFITYDAGLYLSNGIVYNLSGIARHGNAYMTYQGKSFLSRFYIKIKHLQFEYDFLLKVMAIEGFGKIIGSLDNTIVYAELAVNIVNFKLNLHDFRIMRFSDIQVQLDQARLIKQLTGFILSPITSLFKDRITTSIADGLKEQMQSVMDDFNNEDPLQLREFTNKLVSGMT